MPRWTNVKEMQAETAKRGNARQYDGNQWISLYLTFKNMENNSLGKKNTLWANVMYLSFYVFLFCSLVLLLPHLLISSFMPLVRIRYHLCSGLDTHIIQVTNYVPSWGLQKFCWRYQTLKHPSLWNMCMWDQMLLILISDTQPSSFMLQHTTHFLSQLQYLYLYT